MRMRWLHLPLCTALAMLGMVGCARQAPASKPVAGASPLPAEHATPVQALPDAGRTQPVPADSNPATAAIADAVRSGTHPERLSPMITPPAFQADSYAADPVPYLSTTEPGRVFQTAQPGPGVPLLVPMGPTSASLDPGHSVDLVVHAPPGSPVSWLSTDLGSFANKLVSITLATGADGVCRATFTATPGVSGRVNILAGSPMATGQVRFTVDVQASGLAPMPANP